MEKLLDLLNNNNVKYYLSDYAGKESILIRKNKYKIEIYKDGNYYVSDLQRVPYTWGVMGTTTLEYIVEDLKNYLEINITSNQLKLF